MFPVMTDHCASSQPGWVTSCPTWQCRNQRVVRRKFLAAGDLQNTLLKSGQLVAEHIMH